MTASVELTRESLRQSLIVRLPLLLRALPRRPAPGAFGIFMYHRVAPRTPGLEFPTSNVTPDRFREQLAGLLERGYRACSLREVLAHHHRGEAPPPRTFVVTFDDGYANNFLHAWPILQELRVPATIFLATAYLDSATAFPFEDWGAAQSQRAPAEHWRPLTLRECHALLAEGLVEFGAHTHTHGDFRCSPSEFADDLQRSLAFLSAQFGLNGVPFAYPYGKRASGFSGPDLVAAARRSGVTCGLTSENELTRIQDDPFTWSRLTASQYDTAATLAAKLDGVYGAARDYWRGFRNAVVWNRVAPVPVLAPAPAPPDDAPGAAYSTPRVETTPPDNAAATPETAAPGEASLESQKPQSDSAPASRPMKHLTLALADQAIVSATNFLTAVIVGRVSGREGLGVYYLAFSILLLLRGVQNALVSSPYMVYWPRYQGRRGSHYLGSTMAHVAVLALAATLCLCVSWGLVSWGFGPPLLRPELGILAAIIPCVMFRDQARNVEMSNGKLLAVNALDFVVAAIQLGGLLVLTWSGAFSVESVFWIIGLASAVAFVGWYGSGRFPRRWQRGLIARDWQRNWSFGKWALCSLLIGSSTSLIMPWITAIGIDKAASGALGACLSLIGFTNVYSVGIEGFVTPRAAEAYVREGKAALWKWIRWTGFLQLGGLAAFCLLVYWMGDSLIMRLYGKTYQGLGNVLLILSLGAVSRGFKITSGCGLWAMDQPRASFVSDACSLAVFLLLAALLVGPWGIFGVAVATLVSSTVAAITNSWSLYRVWATAAPPTNGFHKRSN